MLGGICLCVLQLLDPTISAYFDRRFPSSANANDAQKRLEFEEALRTSTTVYIGNLAFTTSDFQLYEVCPVYQQGSAVKKAASCLATLSKPSQTFLFVAVL